MRAAWVARAPLVEVDLGLFAADVGEAAPHTLDRGERELHLHLAVQVGVQHAQDVLEVRLVHDHRPHGCGGRGHARELGGAMALRARSNPACSHRRPGAAHLKSTRSLRRRWASASLHAHVALHTRCCCCGSRHVSSCRGARRANSPRDGGLRDRVGVAARGGAPRARGWDSSRQQGSLSPPRGLARSRRDARRARSPPARYARRRRWRRR